MEVGTRSKFTESMGEFVQYLCYKYIEFEKSVTVTGVLCVDVDMTSKSDITVSEKLSFTNLSKKLEYFSNTVLPDNSKKKEHLDIACLSHVCSDNSLSQNLKTRKGFETIQQHRVHNKNIDGQAYTQSGPQCVSDSELRSHTSQYPTDVYCFEGSNCSAEYHSLKSEVATEETAKLFPAVHPLAEFNHTASAEAYDSDTTKTRQQCQTVQGSSENSGRQDSSAASEHHRSVSLKPYRCHLCGCCYSNRSNLRRHIQQHEKAFSCEFCAKDFGSRSDLQRHRRSHTGERPFICSTCGRSFADSSALRAHELMHRGVKPFTCTYCNKQFRTLGTLKTHTYTHTGEKPYQCSNCGACFTQKAHLNTHKKKHDGISWT